MTEAAQTLRDWDSFFVIVGSSAGALTGLQFVVLTLVADIQTDRDRTASISAFGSPTVVHFCVALVISAIFSAPWVSLRPVGVASALAGAAVLLLVIIGIHNAWDTVMYVTTVMRGPGHRPRS